MDTGAHKTKVLFVITKSNFGGAQRYVYDLATDLPADQYEVVVALGGDGELKTKLDFADVRVISIRHLERDISFSNELRASRHMAEIIRQEQPQVLHLNSSKAGAMGALIGRFLRVPRIIFTAHGWVFNEDRGVISRLLFKSIYWLTILLAHHTITVSDAVRAQMNWWGTGRRMTTVRLGRSLPEYMSRGEARATLCKLEPALHPHQHDIWTISIGELHPVKQHTVAIEAVASLVSQHPTLRHIIIGSGELHDTLTADIHNRGLSEHVFLLGQVNEAAQHLKAADVFVLPSRSEALGYVVLEAAAAGVPTVASNVGGIPEILTDGVAGTLVPAGDSTALANSISNYLTHPEQATAHGEAALARSRDFSVERMVAETEAVYAVPTT